MTLKLNWKLTRKSNLEVKESIDLEIVNLELDDFEVDSEVDSR